MRITIFGTGYVGLVTGACLAEIGNDVLCIDVDKKKIEALKRGEVPIFEPGLEALVRRTTKSGRLQFTTDIPVAVSHGLLLFIAVGTPPDESGSADLQHVLAVARSIGEHLDDYRLVVNKSTVPVGTASKVRAEIQSVLDIREIQVGFDVASNPEFLKEGAAIEDFTKPDRVIIGSDSAHASELLRKLYEPFNRNHERVIVMDICSAELTKYAANAMLATKISFMNELANVAELVGADIEQVRVGIGSDPRIGYSFIYPGCGYGGSCFPKDVQALSASAEVAGYDSELINAVENVNQRQKKILFQKIKQYFKGNLAGKVVGLWGLAFKPNTDDMREAPSLSLMSLLWAAGCRIQAYDPAAMDEAKRIFGSRDDLMLCESAVDAVCGADFLAVVTEWKEFQSPDFNQLKALLKTPVIFDGRNIYDSQVLKDAGIDYFGIGRGDLINVNHSEISIHENSR
ncbi:MAG: UDP-glucose 6-dehydrogenase [Legionellales bacterium]|nr:UDP-glucose 6-dehydrogenase [Legionellales bacterium]